MTRSIFGWSYPPGCSGPPEGPDPSELECKISELLDAAGISEEYMNQICDLVSEAEYDLQSRRENGLELENYEEGIYYVLANAHEEDREIYMMENGLK